MLLGKLEVLLLTGQITEEEYKEKKAEYIDLLFELYIKDIITKEQLYEKMNE